MTALLESPLPAILGGIVLLLLLAIAYFAVPKRGIVIAMGVAAAGIVGLVLLERTITTEREEVEIALLHLAKTLETNDVAAVQELIAPDATLVRNAAQRHMPRYQINEVHVARDLEVTVDSNASPPKAIAKFTCRVNANDRKGELPYNSALLEFSIHFRKDGDRWLVESYDVDQPEIKMGK